MALRHASARHRRGALGGAQTPTATIRRVKAVIVGCGRVGATLARRLVAAGHHVTVVDLQRSAFTRLGDDFPGDMVVGNGIDEDTLRHAGIEGADAFASVTNGDNRNLMSAQIAKDVFQVPRVITRIYDPIRASVYREIGLETICSTTISANIIHDFMLGAENRARAAEEASDVAVPAVAETSR